MIRTPLYGCRIFLLLILLSGISSAASVNATSAAETTPAKSGGSIYFETVPPDAIIWLDNVELGTSPFTYFTEKTGTLDVLVRKKGYRDFKGNVTVVNGTRVLFYTILTEVTGDLSARNTPPAPVQTATTIRKSTLKIPTTWPTDTPASPADPVIVLGAAGIGLFLIRRR